MTNIFPNLFLILLLSLTFTLPVFTLTPDLPGRHNRTSTTTHSPNRHRVRRSRFEHRMDNQPDFSGYSYFSYYPLTDNNYNRNIRPHEGAQTDHVNIGLFVNSVRSVSEIDMTMILDAFLQAQWTDHRLKPTWNRLSREIYGDNCTSHENSECSELVITLGKAFSEAIWRPDFYIPSAINIYPADDYNDNVCVKLQNDGSIFYSNRVIITISCPMKLVYFPFDSHTCTVCIGSYKYHDQLVKMTWSADLSGMYDNQATANFMIRNESVLSVLNAENKSMPFIGDVFTEHCFEIVIDRKYNIFLVTLYLPSVALVALSWVNFWIDPKAIPARAGLSITAILAQITLIVGMAGRFPSVSDLKMADLYLTINFIYTFATLIEFAIVSYKPEDESISRKTVSRRRSSVINAERRQLQRSNSANNEQTHSLLLHGVNSYSLTNGTKSATHSPNPNRNNDVLNSVYRNSISVNRMTRSDELFGQPSASAKQQQKAREQLFLRFQKRRKRKQPTVRKNVDNVSKFFFPATFGLWNVVFFTSNLYLADRLDMLTKSFIEFIGG
ncbi:glycine receptor subunit alpha-4-like [Convolutriloba macropyga]|uniref:glycine receptor subunit alpha-4-like n=1 Tax=Convolutriloba macropyga TaxID=536237 RepID=UPI003F51C413